MKNKLCIILIVLIVLLSASLACISGGGGGGGGNAQATKSAAIQTMAAEHWRVQLTAQAGAVEP